MKKFGTFGGVYTPSLLTILGVIMYLRMGWVVGNAGTLTIVIGMIILAHVVSISSGLSISSIATDKKIKSGGIYYILSRSLGFPFGGAIGLTLYIATALSISLYLIGFSESLLSVIKNWLPIEEVTINHLRIVGSISLLLIVSVAYISTSFAIKTQYFILSAIVLSLASIFLGSSEGKQFDTSSVNAETLPSFGVIFGIFFPAVTGFTAGVAMSGDLKHPEKSIPWGTLLAIFSGFIVYIILAIFIYNNIPRAELITNNNAIVEFSWIPQIVIAGIWGATLSSALGGILGGPRILQSMSLDRITPRIFGLGVGKENEPRNALLLTFFLAEIGILIGELNSIAGVVAMFYMAAYLVINLSCFLEIWASPDFRPKFKINIFIPLLGVVTIFLLMIQLNLVAALASIFIIAVIFIYLTRKQLVLSSGDVWSSVWSSVVKLGLKNLDKKPKNKRNWEPNILVFSGGTHARPHLINLSKAIAGKGGMISNFDLIENQTAIPLFPKREQSMEQNNLKDGIIFQRKQECSSLFKGIEAIASTYGFSGIEPNTTLMGWARNTKDPIMFAQLNQKLNNLDYNILYLDYDKEKGFGSYNTIDIWWNDINSISELTIQISKRLLVSNDWNTADIRVLYLNNNHQKHIIESIISKKFTSLRIDYPFQIISNEVDQKPFYEVVKQYSADTDLIMLGIPKMKQGEEASFVQESNDFLCQMGTTLLVSASNNLTKNSKMLLDVENSYQLSSKHIELHQTEINPIKLSGINDLDDKIEQIDSNFIALNQRSASDIYTPLIDLYKSFLGLLKERYAKKSNNSILSYLEIKQSLVEDWLSNQRFEPIANSIQNAVINHLNQTKKIINAAPKIIIRFYDDEELIVGEDDSEALIKTKKKLSTRKTEKIRLHRTISRFYNHEYLEKLSQELLLIGVCAKSINDKFISWIYNLDETSPIDIGDIEKELDELYSSMFTNGLTKLNAISRELFNTVVSASNKNDVENEITINRQKLRRRKRKAISELIVTYSQTWLSNIQLLSNQLSLAIQLLILQIKTTSNVTVTSQSIEKYLLDKTLKLIKKYRDNSNTISIDTINEIKREIYKISNHKKLDNAFVSIQSEMEKNISSVEETINLINHNQLLRFNLEQDDIGPTSINARTIVKSVIENEIIASLKDLYEDTINEGRSENTKLDNALELLKYSILIKTNDEKKMKVIHQKIDTQFADSVESINRIRTKHVIEVKELLGKLKSLLAVETIIEKADDFNTPFQKIGKKKIISSINAQIERWKRLLDSFLEKSIDKVAESEFRYRAKSLQNPHSVFANFSELVSLNKKIERKLPFYYKQLFTENQVVASKLLDNRKTELVAVKKAVDRFHEGKNGAILFTGDHFSGKTYLMQTAMRLYFPKNIISISAPNHNAVLNKELLDNAFANATGLKGDAVAILGQIKKRATIVFQDLELWWTRSSLGSECLIHIIHLIKQFGATHLFVIDCNTLFYQHIHQYLPIDGQLLETIITSSLSISEIKKAIMERHRIGGVNFNWKNKSEHQLGVREINKLFKKITSQSEGNIGMALYIWLGSISTFSKNELFFPDLNDRQFPTDINPEWENMLEQLLIHKRISINRLEEIYRLEPKNEVENTLNSLIRTGLVIKTTSMSYCVSPYILPYLMKYFNKKLNYDSV